MTATARELAAIQAAKGQTRLDEQRAGFERLARAIERAGFRPAAREFRREAEKAVERGAAFERERSQLVASDVSLAEIRSVLDAELPDASRDGRKLTDAERVEWIIEQWKTVSRALAASESSATR